MGKNKRLASGKYRGFVAREVHVLWWQQPWSQLLVKAVPLGPGGEAPDAFASLYRFALHTCSHYLSHSIGWCIPSQHLVIQSYGTWLLGDPPSGTWCCLMTAGCLTWEKSSNCRVSSFSAKRDRVTHPSDHRWLCNRRDGMWKPS